MSIKGTPFKLSAALGVVVMVAGCNKPLDFDLRNTFGSKLDTSAAVRKTVANRPRPDARGVISYPNYQVAIARRGDTLADVAARVGVDANALARHNGMTPQDKLRNGEVIALAGRVAEPSPATGGTGMVVAPDKVDITSLAGSAIDKADTAPHIARPKPQTGYEPIRHTVARGETAYTIARLYNVSARSLAEWNGLDNNLAVREGQQLMIPPARPADPAVKTAALSTSKPGTGTVISSPPSAAKPLPKDTPKSAKAAKAAAQKTKPPATAALKQTRSTRMSAPVAGSVVRDYIKGKNNGVDFAGTPGAAVKAADAGKVAAITKNADNVQIVVLRHAGNVMTVYYNVSDVAVKKGESVKRGQSIAKVPAKDSTVHFEVRKGFDSVDPNPYLNS